MRKQKTKSPAPRTEVNVADKAGELILCTLNEVEDHLRAFVATFVLTHAQHRWLEFLIDKREVWNASRRTPHSISTLHKAEAVLRTFPDFQRNCARASKSDRSEVYLHAPFNAAPGVYFALNTPPCKMTALQADLRFSWEDESALLSFEPGKTALFYCHDGSVWKCEKR